MSVRKVSAKEMLGGKSLVMSANPAIGRGFKKLQEARTRQNSSGDGTKAAQKRGDES